MQFKITKMALKGNAIAHTLVQNGEIDEKVIFLPFGAPDDIVEGILTENHKNYAFGKITQIHSSGADRIEPPCPYFFRSDSNNLPCGGCDWQHLSYKSQLRWKMKTLEETLEKIGGIHHTVLFPISESDAWRYRNKAAIPFAPPLTPQNSSLAGFYAPGTHEIVPFDDCLILPEIAVHTFHQIKKLAEELNLPPYDEKTREGWLRHLLLRTNQKGEILVILVTRTPAFEKRADFVQKLTETHPQVIGIHQNIQPARTHSIVGKTWIKIWGSSTLDEIVCEIPLKISPGSFLQVNIPVAERIYKLVEKWCFEETKENPSILDLYSGVGMPALLLAQKGARVTGVEENPYAMRDARSNADRNKIPHLNLREGRVEHVLPKISRSKKFNVAVIDPPRGGATPDVLRLLADRKIPRVIYISCHPATLARDIKYLSQAGYTVRIVQPFDMFPQTSHIESATLLERTRP